jgi:hypothetical protein
MKRPFILATVLAAGVAVVGACDPKPEVPNKPSAATPSPAATASPVPSPSGSPTGSPEVNKGGNTNVNKGEPAKPATTPTV